MASFNRVIIIGNLTRDPELRTIPSGKAVTDVTLAINDYHNKDGKDNTTFVDVTIWERNAENVCQYMRKGSPLLVEGRLTQDKWEDKETGKKMSKLKVVAVSVQFIGSKGEGENRGSSSGGDYSERHSAARNSASHQSADANAAFSNNNDIGDIPF